jgi:hypothetical protein
VSHLWVHPPLPSAPPVGQQLRRLTLLVDLQQQQQLLLLLVVVVVLSVLVWPAPACLPVVAACQPPAEASVCAAAGM